MSSGNHANDPPGDESNALDTARFRTIMEKVVDQHSTTYSMCIAKSFRWENDNTAADQDAQNFQSVLRSLGFKRGEEFVISSNDVTPGWTVLDEFRTMLKEAISYEGRTIVFVHYAGHGTEFNGDLHFVDGNSKMSFRVYQTFFLFVGEQSYLEGKTNVDVVFLFDGCYSHLATRSSVTTQRVVEVLAATDEIAPDALTPPKHASFTGKLANELAARKDRGDNDVELAELMETLRSKSPRRKPVHGLHIGYNSIRFKFPAVSTHGHPPVAQSPSLQAVFAFHISESLTEEQLSDFVSWIRKLPSNVGLELEGVYETNSMRLILRSAYSVFSKLAGLPFINLICETKPPQPSSTGPEHPRCGSRSPVAEKG
ncbi:hypothetical protein PHISP_03062 [Aspergillus sp. HF37]|nr:hypothetical protein PHISP_03062 [Aspergillus sp. HF37]